MKPNILANISNFGLDELSGNNSIELNCSICLSI